MPKTAILFHSYCLAVGEPYRLTAMTEESVFAVLRLLQERPVSFIFISAAYETWIEEATLKSTMFLERGVAVKQFKSVAPINNSFDEVEKARQLINELGVTHLIVVAEEWHAPRAEMIARAMLPGLPISLVSFQTPLFERAHEPHPIPLLGWIKSIRAAYKPLWIAWNISLLILTPFLLWWKQSKKKK